TCGRSRGAAARRCPQGRVAGGWRGAAACRAAGAGGEADRPPRRRLRAGAMAAIARPRGEPAGPAPGMADPDTAAPDIVGLDSAGRDSADPDTADSPAAGGRSARSRADAAESQKALRTG